MSFYSLSRESLTCFEDLSNELIYEIFEYLNHFHVYESFFNLNIRFDYLLIDSNLPVKIDLSSLSKSSWKRYNEYIIENINMDRITTFRINESCMYDHVLSSFDQILSFNRIENLILENIEYIYLDSLIDQISSLSSLSSLIISTKGDTDDRTKIYRGIFRLRTLKYCNLSLLGQETIDSLPINVDQCSSIKYLVIQNSIGLHELDNLLSYVPQLCRLSLHLIKDNRNRVAQRNRFPWRGGQILMNPIIPGSPFLPCEFACRQLMHIDLCINDIRFDGFVQLLKKFAQTIEVMYLTLEASQRVLPGYIDANKWEQLITSHLSNLRIFDIQIDLSMYNDTLLLNMENQLNQFLSPFWIFRQWFFGYHCHSDKHRKHVSFYSTNPYRYN